MVEKTARQAAAVIDHVHTVRERSSLSSCLSPVFSLSFSAYNGDGRPPTARGAAASGGRAGDDRDHWTGGARWSKTSFRVIVHCCRPLNSFRHLPVGLSGRASSRTGRRLSKRCSATWPAPSRSTTADGKRRSWRRRCGQQSSRPWRWRRLRLGLAGWWRRRRWTSQGWRPLGCWRPQACSSCRTSASSSSVSSGPPSSPCRWPRLPAPSVTHVSAVTVDFV